MDGYRAVGTTILLLGCVTSAALGQTTKRLPDRLQRVELSLFGGGTAYSDFHRTMLGAPPAVGSLGASGDVAAGRSAPQLRRLTAETAPTFGAAVGYWVTRHWGVRLHGALAPSRFHVISGSPRSDPRLHAATDTVTLASLFIWTADAAILFRLPFEFGGIMPYGMIGGGTLEYRARPDAEQPVPPEAAAGIGSGAYSQPVALLGGGASAPLSWRGSMLSFELTAHFGRSPARPSDGALAAGRETAAGRAGDAAPVEHGPGDPQLTSQLRFLVGLTIPLFGDRMRAGPPVPPMPPLPPMPGGAERGEAADAGDVSARARGGGSPPGRL